MAQRVAILGGGVGGLSAAHELIERGFTVDVYEQRATPGGKARGIPVDGSGTGGRPDLPGEHGFRFFPGFYKHLPDTMKRIPFPGNAGGVFDNLVQAREYLIAANSRTDLTFLVRFPTGIDDLREALMSFFNARKLGIPGSEVEFFAGRLLILLTSCQERRLGQFEKIPWWQFIHADNMSEAYQTYLARGLTRSLVAMRAEIASTRTVGDILIQLLLDLYNPLVEFDRVLNAPTNVAWLTPWRDYLESAGVNFHFRHDVTAVECVAGRIASVTVIAKDDPAALPHSVVADHYVSALPVERLVPLVTPLMKAADPGLANLGQLMVAWMNGIQFFLRDNQSFAEGHILFATSAWSLTAISQAQFWGRPVTDYGDGTATGVLSVDISNWEAPGIVFGKPANQLDSPEQIKQEVQAQIRLALRADLAHAIDDANIVRWFLDDDVTFPNPHQVINLEPLLINVQDSWQFRPEAVTKIDNFFLASDFVRTHTDLATMEGANEAARRAVNGILEASGSGAPPCELWPLQEPLLFAPFREIDRQRYATGMPHLTAAETIEEEMARTLQAAVAPPFGVPPGAPGAGGDVPTGGTGAGPGGAAPAPPQTAQANPEPTAAWQQAPAHTVDQVLQMARGAGHP